MAKRKSKSDKTDILKEIVLGELEKSLGIVTIACKSAKVGRSTFYEWKAKDEDFRAKVEDIETSTLDFVEHKLLTQIGENNTTATIFYLKTKGKKRGYVERQEIVGADGQNPVMIMLPDNGRK